MNTKMLRLELSGPQTGVSLYNGKDYLGTYLSSHECVLDLLYHYGLDETDPLLSEFAAKNHNGHEIEPYVYRGVCSELFLPTDKLFSYVYYANTLTELFEKFAFHEKRALRFGEQFEYGVQGTGIHLLDGATRRYGFWVGGTHIKTVADVMNEVKRNGLKCPTALEKEYQLNPDRQYDVFISHRSSAYGQVKPVYDFLTGRHLSVFLSEHSLPALSNADYTDEINKALDCSRNLILYVNSIEDISTGWVKYEWSSFINEKNSGRKDGNLITILAPGLSPSDLPYMLRQFEAIPLGSFENAVNYILTGK